MGGIVRARWRWKKIFHYHTARKKLAVDEGFYHTDALCIAYNCCGLAEALVQYHNRQARADYNSVQTVYEAIRNWPLIGFFFTQA
eukprot:scaffold64632_cov25-Prasinocladus_malaysianus.AAC.2